MVISNRALIAIPVCTVLPLSALAAILLSLYAQRLRGPRTIHLDTYVLTFAWLIGAGLAGLTAHSATAGDLGRPGVDVQAVLLRVAASRYAHQILTISAIQLVRAGVLLLYRRIFATRGFKRAVDGMLALTALYFAAIAVGFTVLFVKYPSDRGAPVNTRAYYLASSAASMALDVATLCMPVAVIRTLQMTAQKKVGLVAVFGLGFVCIGASCARVYYFAELLRLRDLRAAGAVIYHINIWAVVEPFVSIIAACLPTCATMLRDTKLAPRRIVSGVAGRLSSRKSASHGRSQTGPGGDGSALRSLKEGGKGSVSSSEQSVV